MSQATFSVRMDNRLKEQFEALCEDFGMNMSTAINVFARAVVRERKIPFDIAAADPEITRERFARAVRTVREKAAADFPDGISLEEINAEIDRVRKGVPDKA